MQKRKFRRPQAHRKRGKSACASPTPHHTLNEEGSARFTAQPLSALVVTVHFSAALKALVLGNLFKVFRLDITFAREVCHLGIKMKKIWQSSHSFHYPQWQKARANVMANLSNLNELPKTRVSLQLKMDRLKYWSWWLYFSSRREPSVLKTGRKFPYILYRALLRFLGKRKGKIHSSFVK